MAVARPQWRRGRVAAEMHGGGGVAAATRFAMVKGQQKRVVAGGCGEDRGSDAARPPAGHSVREPGAWRQGGGVA